MQNAIRKSSRDKQIFSEFPPVGSTTGKVRKKCLYVITQSEQRSGTDRQDTAVAKEHKS